MKALLLVLAAQQGWTKLADPPQDPAGREMSPGMMGAWAYVPEMKAFILYGGRTPAFGNGLWSFDPSSKQWKLVVPCDRLVEEKSKQYSVRRPGEIPWSKDRPAPGSDYGCAYDPGSRSVWIVGGWRFDGVGDWGGTKFGTWRFDGASKKFLPGPDGGSSGRLACDSKRGLLISSPQGKGTTWVFSGGKWEKRTCDPAPKPSGNAAMAFDEKAGVLVYFDDWGQTWTYDAVKNAWTDAKPSKAPPHRRHAACWYDPEAGRVFLHGGISQDYPVGKATPGREDYVSFYTNEWGLQYADLWSYDAAKNEWREERAEGAPAQGKKPIFRDLCCYVPTLKAAVMYESTVGVWSFRYK